MSNWKQGYIPDQPKPLNRQTQPPSNNDQHPPLTQHTYQPQLEYHVPQQQVYVQEQQTQASRSFSVQKQRVKPKRSIPLFISLVLGVIFFIVLVSGTFSRADQALSQTANTANEVGYQLGTMIGTALMIPQMIATGISVILNGVGWAIRSRSFALAGAILYCVSAVLMIVNAPFLLPSIVFSFIGFSKLKN